MKMRPMYGCTIVLLLLGGILIIDSFFTNQLPEGAHIVFTILFLFTLLVRKLAKLHEHLSCNLYKGGNL